MEWPKPVKPHGFMSLFLAVVFPNDRKIDGHSSTIWCWSFLYSVLHKCLVMCFPKLLELVQQEEKALCFLKCPLTFSGKPLQNKPLVPPLSPPPSPLPSFPGAARWRILFTSCIYCGSYLLFSIQRIQDLFAKLVWIKHWRFLTCQLQEY